MPQTRSTKPQPAVPPGVEEPREPCPSPLTAAQVLQAFRGESRSWEVARPGGPLSGRTWGEGPPLYFLNGLGGTFELYALSVWLLREDFRCVLFDYPQRPRGRRRPATTPLADDLFAVADLHGDASFRLFATSFGSMVALTAMHEQPERIPRAVLQGAFAHRRLSAAERMLVRLGRLLPGTIDRLPGRRVIQRQNHRPWFPPFDAARWDFFLQNTGQVPIRAQARRASVLRDADLRPWLPEIRQPVLLIRSEGEGLVSTRCQEELEHGLPHASSEWLSGCGHLPFLTHPHRLARLISTFLSDEEATTSSPGRSALV